MLRLSRYACIGIYTLTLFSSSIFASYFPAPEPRVTLWGTTGAETIGRLDALLPVISGYNSLIYTDIQAKLDQDNSWLGSGGLGYRQVVSRSTLLGGYLFLDRNFSKNHNVFWILSPGVELFKYNLDFRLNGYFPLSERRKDGRSFFPSGGNNTCGNNGDCSFIEFRGHQQFEHKFVNFEEIGSGGDAQVGWQLPFLRGINLIGGVYYYHLANKGEIRGVGSEVDIAISPRVAFTAAADYDNKQKRAIVAGLRIQLGHTKPVTQSMVHERLYDDVPRNLATLATSGTGIPVLKGTADKGLVLERDNIYFFTSQDGVPFDGTTNSGTIERPLAANQFNNTNLVAIAALTPNANFYFNPGSYTANVTLQQGQSMFGRTEDYKCSAVSFERPRFNGFINLFFGDNTLDSFILQNTSIGTGSTTNIVFGIATNNASNVVICNDEIDVSANITGTNNNQNTAVGIVPNNSSITIENSVINVSTSIAASNFGNNETVGIGNAIGLPNNGNVQNNSILIENTAINATANLGGNNEATNEVVGIGAVFNGTATSSNFFNNRITLENDTLSAIATIQQSNSSQGAENSVIGIGGDSTIADNIVNVNHSQINVQATNGGNILNATQTAVGIGLAPPASTGNVGILLNSIFNVRNSTITVLAEAALNQNPSSSNFAYGAGGFPGTAAPGTVFNINRTKMNISAIITGNQSQSSNFARGVLITAGGTANIFESDFSVLASVDTQSGIGLPPPINNAAGLFTDTPTATVNIADSFVKVRALVNTLTAGGNVASGTDGSGTFNVFNTIFDVAHNP